MLQKWIALSNTTIGQLMATINTSIIIVALPPIFRGIHLNPLAPQSFPYLLWTIMSYMIVVSVLLLTIGRLSDMYGRVRLFNLGFLIFTIGSILLYLTPGTGYTAATELIIFRIVQAVGGSFIMANSFAIITDNFPSEGRGFALSINSVAAVSGVSIGIVLGGFLSVIYWRDVFLISVPVGIFGTFWSYFRLKETSMKKRDRLDIPGNILFAAGIIIILIGVTYGITPYGKNPMGWTNPFVIISLLTGTLLLIIFPFIEKKSGNPMFRIDFFKIKGFSIGNFTAFISAMEMMGLMYMLTILFQGVWLPIHGYPFYITPLWAGIYILPMTVSMGLFGILGGRLSDRYGFRILTSAGLFISAFSLVLLAFLPYNFSYYLMGIILVIFGIGYGLFNAPNISAVMSVVPPEARGTASGMVNTMRNTGYTASMGLFFSILIYGLSKSLPVTISSGLRAKNAGQLIPYLIHMPPTEAIFGTFLGINPVSAIISGIPGPVISSVPANALSTITGNTWFSYVFAPAFMGSLDTVFFIVAGITVFAGLISLLRDRDRISIDKKTGSSSKIIKRLKEYK